MYVPASEPLLSRFQQRQLFFSSAPRRHSHFPGDTTFAVYATVGILRALALSGGDVRVSVLLDGLVHI